MKMHDFRESVARSLGCCSMIKYDSSDNYILLFLEAYCLCCTYTVLNKLTAFAVHTQFTAADAGSGARNACFRSSQSSDEIGTDDDELGDE